VAPRIQIGQLLVQAGRISAEQLDRALAHQQKWGGRIGDALLGMKLVTEPTLLAELARQHGVAYVQIGERFVPPEVVRLVPQKYIRSRRVFPFALGPGARRGTLFVATAEPQNLPLLDEIAFMTGMSIQPVLVGDADLRETIKRNLGPSEAGACLPRGAGAHPSLGAGGSTATATSSSGRPKVVQLRHPDVEAPPVLHVKKTVHGSQEVLAPEGLADARGGACLRQKAVGVLV
jgi:type IV pilus assembly protein PilB